MPVDPNSFPFLLLPLLRYKSLCTWISRTLFTLKSGHKAGLMQGSGSAGKALRGPHMPNNLSSILSDVVEGENWFLKWPSDLHMLTMLFVPHR